MKRLEYTGIKEENKAFKLENGHDFRVQLNLLPPGRYFVAVQKEYKKATRKQFAWLYNGIYEESLIALNNEGYDFYDVDEVDLFWKSLFANKKVANPETGEIITMPMSKREFLTIDHAAYVANIRYYTSVYLHADIADPDVNWKEHKREMQLLIEKQNESK
jgi:hypothetical protein